MDPFYALIVFLLLVVFDTLAQQRWLAAYYRFGLPVTFADTLVSARKGAIIDPQPYRGFDQQTAAALQERFKGRPAHPSIQFHPVPGGALAFREQLFENRGGFKYLPVMHSTARLRPENGQIKVTGYLNLWVIFTLGYSAYRAAVEPGFVPVALLVLLVLVISFATQAGINRQVARALTEVSFMPGAGRGEA